LNLPTSSLPLIPPLINAITTTALKYEAKSICFFILRMAALRINLSGEEKVNPSLTAAPPVPIEHILI